MTDNWYDEDEQEDETGENYALVYVDGDKVGRDWLDVDRVQVSFPAAENGEQSEADEKAPLGWCNSAAITLDRNEDAVHLSISVGDPRGAFCFTVRRTSDGRLIMHFPTPEDGMLHMSLKPLHAGTYEIG